MNKRLLTILFIIILCQNPMLSAEHQFDTILSFSPKTEKAEIKSETATENTVTQTLDKADEVIDTTTEIIQKKTDKIKESANQLKENIQEQANSVQDKIQKKMTINEEIEQAKKEMDNEAESLQDIYEQAAQLKTPNKQIFDEDNMEVLGKTFWGRKPIHPIGKYGYTGRLPDIVTEFEYKKTKDEYKCLIPSNPNATKKDLIPAPRNNPAYVDIVVKKGGTSQYVNDVNDVIFILQKLIVNIEEDVNVQRFNAQVSGLLDNIFYIQDKYKNKPEANYISFYKMLELANIARDTAILRTEAQAYSKYLAYSGEGAMYRPERIQKQMDLLLEEINKTLVILKAVN